MICIRLHTDGALGMLKLFGGLLDRIFVLACALIFALIPHFYQSYTQRLGGHAAELQIQLENLRSIAQISGREIEEYIQKFINSSDPDIVLQGEFMEAMQKRSMQISAAYMAMIRANAFSRPTQFIQHFQFDIAKKTLMNFQPGITFSSETGVYTLFGVLLSYLFSFLIKKMTKLTQSPNFISR